MSIKRVINFLSHPKTAFFLILWFIVLLFLGTFYQKEYGLYLAQKKFFFSLFFLWEDLIPLPGGLLTMALFTLSLAFQLLFKTRLNWEKSGIFLIHLGAFLMLIRGPLSIVSREEGFLEVREGEKNQTMVSYYQLELALINYNISNHYDQVTSIPESMLVSKKEIQQASLPFKIEIIKNFRNCFIKMGAMESHPKENGQENNFYYNGEGKTLIQMPLKKDFELNHACIHFKIVNQIDKGEQVVTLLQGEKIDLKDYGLEMILRLKESPLPFSIYLEKFKKEFHPETNMPKSFESLVRLVDEKRDYNVLIKMNNPLRYHEYTLYQSSYRDNESKNVSIFAVVKDIGRLGPYYASIILIIGVLVHLFFLLGFLRKFKKSKKEMTL